MIKIKLYYTWIALNVILWTLIFGSMGVLVSIFEWKGRFMGWVVRTWSKTILSSSGIKFKVEGLENIDSKSHYFFVANHSSAFDIPIVFSGVPFQTVAISKIELKHIPIFGWAMQAGGHIFVDRKNHLRAMDSMNKAKKSMIINPRSVIIFPEGTRSAEHGNLLPFKKGGLVLAIDLNMPVVPIGIIGTSSLVKDKFLSSKNSLKLVFGKPIETKNLTYDDRNDFAIKLREEVLELIGN
ncbi:MAG: hypothetical protein CMG44_02705 [Candidatus Marinimicrobia bacterium]|nr:hypothetical protein [Candidatus Neomarinimicrobiota bacterium]